MEQAARCEKSPGPCWLTAKSPESSRPAGIFGFSRGRPFRFPRAAAPGGEVAAARPQNPPAKPLRRRLRLLGIPLAPAAEGKAAAAGEAAEGPRLLPETPDRLS